MSRQEFGEIAALEYHAPPGMDFPDIVEEFDISSRALSWSSWASWDRSIVSISALKTSVFVR